MDPETRLPLHRHLVHLANPWRHLQQQQHQLLHQVHHQLWQHQANRKLPIILFRGWGCFFKEVAAVVVVVVVVEELVKNNGRHLHHRGRHHREGNRPYLCSFFKKKRKKEYFSLRYILNPNLPEPLSRGHIPVWNLSKNLYKGIKNGHGHDHLLATCREKISNQNTYVKKISSWKLVLLSFLNTNI